MGKKRNKLCAFARSELFVPDNYLEFIATPSPRTVFFMIHWGILQGLLSFEVFPFFSKSF